VFRAILENAVPSFSAFFEIVALAYSQAIKSSVANCFVGKTKLVTKENGNGYEQ